MPDFTPIIFVTVFVINVYVFYGLFLGRYKQCKIILNEALATWCCQTDTFDC